MDPHHVGYLIGRQRGRTQQQLRLTDSKPNQIIVGRKAHIPLKFLGKVELVGVGQLRQVIQGNVLGKTLFHMHQRFPHALGRFLADRFLIRTEGQQI